MDDLRKLTGGEPIEHEARVNALGRTVASVTHDITEQGEMLMIEFSFGGALAIESWRDRPGVLLATWLEGLALAVVKQQQGNPDPYGIPVYTGGRRKPPRAARPRWQSVAAFVLVAWAVFLLPSIILRPHVWTVGSAVTGLLLAAALWWGRT